MRRVGSVGSAVGGGDQARAWVMKAWTLARPAAEKRSSGTCFWVMPSFSAPRRAGGAVSVFKLYVFDRKIALAIYR